MESSRRCADLHIDVPDAVTYIVQTLTSRGHSAFVAGGAVRDALMGRERPDDWDVATSATPDQIGAYFSKVIPTGAKHGTVTVVHDGMLVEVTTFRCDGPYADGRHPEYVSFLPDIEGDLARRDFTVNAMAHSPITGELIDPFGGREDINACLIRAVGDPLARFEEDKLRMVRAVRFASILGFEIESGTAMAIVRSAPGIVQVSVERITDEIMKMMRGPSPDRGLCLLDSTGLLPFVLPEFAALPPHTRASAGDVCMRLPGDACMRMAALLSPLGPEQVRAILVRMRTSTAFASRASRLVRYVCAVRPGMSCADMRRLASRAGAGNIRDIIMLWGAQDDGRDADAAALLSRAEEALAGDPPLALRDLAISGGDIMESAGMSPGPEIRRILERLLDRVLDDPALNTQDRLIALVREELGHPTSG